MLTRLVVRNFKRFREVKIELANPVVLLGPIILERPQLYRHLRFGKRGLGVGKRNVGVTEPRKPVLE